MRKIMIIVALAAMAVTVKAQTADTNTSTSDKFSVKTNTFWSNWFVAGGVTYNMFYTGQEKGMDDKPGLLSGSRSTAGISLAVGKWFTPGLGLRTKLTGFWGRYVSPDATGSLKNKSNNSYKYWTAQEQILFNVHNLLLGYDDERFWECIPFLGFGVTRNMTGNDYAHGYSIGLLNTFKVNSRMAVNFELGFNPSDDMIFNAAATNHNSYGTSVASLDRNFSVELGVTYNLGKTLGWKKTQ